MTNTQTLESNVIYTTYDYSKFKNSSLNREVNKNHCYKLKKSIQRSGQVNPVLVDRQGVVVDGQHRVDVCKELGFPVKYIVFDGNAEEAMIAANTNDKSWSSSDWIDLYAKKGYRDYQELIRVSDKYDLSRGIVAEIFNGQKSGGGCSHLIKDGAFTITKESADVAEVVLMTVVECEKVIGAMAKKRSFIRALKQVVYRNDSFVFTRLATSMKRRPFNVYARTEDTIDEIISSYNYNLKSQANKIS